jgi:hypothetical protein
MSSHGTQHDRSKQLVARAEAIRTPRGAAVESLDRRDDEDAGELRRRPIVGDRKITQPRSDVTRGTPVRAKLVSGAGFQHPS